MSLYNIICQRKTQCTVSFDDLQLMLDLAVGGQGWHLLGLVLLCSPCLAQQLQGWYAVTFLPEWPFPMVSLCSCCTGYKGYQDYRVLSREPYNLRKNSPTAVPPPRGIELPDSIVAVLELRRGLWLEKVPAGERPGATR